MIWGDLQDYMANQFPDEFVNSKVFVCIDGEFRPVELREVEDSTDFLLPDDYPYFETVL
jgi:hypothetical protein